MTKNTLLPLLLIPLLAFLIVQASKNTLAAIHLSNASYQLQSLIQQTNLEQISKAQSALKKVQSLSPNDPAYLNLQANAQLWQAYLKQADD
ncbi:hypothetical protein [sulfur-oxidizing endosymbiont of Gigantopelta aegis]|uniref:hypothetical protein n=1 Tax=sulfur-oxidizing endosymbiont of Gigantopelta aegis TaxID=2794934 RepID=UPI0018DC059F|nr:hypothetical protein [sulfur-oxidizing endosymbiont of Gigantopelta aegis]